jgi:hypothetical protein
MYETPVLPHELQELLDREIKGEQLKWSCQPSYSRAVMRKFWPAFFLGVFFFGLSLSLAFVQHQKAQKGEKVPLPRKTIPVAGVLFGLGVMASPFYIARNAKNTVYAITNKRAIIITKRPSTTDFYSFGANKIKNMVRRIRNDGSGDLIFEKQSSEGKTTYEIGFFGVPEVNRIEGLLAEIA